MERIPTYLGGIYMAENATAAVSETGITFTIYEGGQIVRRLRAPIGSRRAPFAQPSSDGFVTLVLNINFVIKHVQFSPRTPDEGLYEEEFSIVFRPIATISPPSLYTSPANPRTPNWEFVAKIDTVPTLFVRDDTYTPPIPYPSPQISEDDDNEMAPGEKQARQSGGGESTSRGNQNTAANADDFITAPNSPKDPLNPGASVVTEKGGGVSSGAGGASVGWGAGIAQGLPNVYMGPSYGINPPQPSAGQGLPSDLNAEIGGLGRTTVLRPIGRINPLEGPINRPINARGWGGGAFDRQDFYNEMQGLGYRGNPQGEYISPGKASSSMGSAPMIIGGVSVMALLLLLAR